eukprot:GHVS01008922.1.p1 GENE.GHVS01008922.1~~GHVS01008922.1.p1  ORF type:complete len:982 (+),score=115.56 GHVS01008922.1:155-3100(+)
MLGIKHRQEVLDMGIDKYNEQCRSIVMRYAGEWREVVERMGRWIDFDNDYKTLNMDFMESVWWVFKQLFEKQMVYRAFKVMPYSTACNTPLSNFEANLNYKDVSDPSIVVTFPSTSQEGVEYLAWTTTPWTLPSNLALCVHPTLIYCTIDVKKFGKRWVVCESRLPWICKELKLDLEVDVKIVDKVVGSQLVGNTYKPLFSYFADVDVSAFRVVADDYVTDDTGTGMVHCAPAFGEDDYRICIRESVIEKGGFLPCPVDDDGLFTQEVSDFVGVHVKAAEKPIKAKLKAAGRLLINGEIVHSYPHCWRSDTPLIYRAVPCWFVKVEQLKDRLIANNQLTYWVPSFVKEKRFHNWLCDARDWCVSRNRFWGTPIPLWCSEDFTQIKCIGSVAELEEFTARHLKDIHRHLIDDITIPDPRGPAYPHMRRIDEVFDCWFESGSMPYGQLHYPFENKEKFTAGFPADFIAEGLDQTRGWFYTLLVLSTALFDKPAFKNIIVNGLVLASDGKKMSKRLKNYPDPMEVVNTHGADALRLYLVSSPVVRAESLRFKEEGVRDIVKDVLLPWYHAYRFLVQEVTRYEVAEGILLKPSALTVKQSDNIMDRWINSYTQHLIQFFMDEMQSYRLYTVVPKLLSFLDSLTNWYVRFNRDRMRGAYGTVEACTSLCTLYEVLLSTCRIMAPFSPFMSELMYQNLRSALSDGDLAKELSVHMTQLPGPDMSVVHGEIETKMERMQSVINLCRAMRERRKVSLKTPLKSLTVIHQCKEYLADIESVQSYIRDELNVVNVSTSSDTSLVVLSAVPNFKTLGARLASSMKQVQAAVKELTHDQVEEYEKTGSIVVCDGIALSGDDLLVNRLPSQHANENLVVDGDNSVLVMLDFTSNEALQQMSTAREIANRIQKIKKQLNLTSDVPVEMWACSGDAHMSSLLAQQNEYINKCLRRTLNIGVLPEEAQHNVIHREWVDVAGGSVEVILSSRQTKGTA